MNALFRVAYRCLFAAIALNVVGARFVHAHDFWVEPSTFHAAPGELVNIGLRVGENFQGDAVPRNSARIERFLLVGPGGEQPVAGQDGKDPAGVARLDRPGLYIIGYRSQRSSIELEPAKFEEYLKEEGLTRISALRAERGESDKPGKEVYSRAAKAFVRVGDGGAAGFDKPIGFPYEIIAAKNPFDLRLGQDDFIFVLLREGKPAAGMEVFAMSQTAPAAALRAVTDQAGQVTFRLPTPGLWMIKSIHMAPAPPGLGADWESIWATLTFELISPSPNP